MTVIDAEATEAVGRLTERYPFLTRVCRMTPHDNDLDELLAGAPVALPPDRVFICYDDEQQALKTALTAEQLWPGGSGAVVVRLDRLASCGRRSTAATRCSTSCPGRCACSASCTRRATRR